MFIMQRVELQIVTSASTICIAGFLERISAFLCKFMWRCAVRNNLYEYRVGVSETSGRILKKFGVWATLHVSSVSLIFVRTGPIVACVLYMIFKLALIL
jgi:hypothetical protein